MSLRAVARLEWSIIRADRTLYWMAALIACVLSIAAFSGASQIRAKTEVLQKLVAADADKTERLQLSWDQVMQGKLRPEPFANPTDPASVGSGLGARYNVLPYEPLAFMALGQADLYPNYYRVTTRNKTTFLYDGELENPWRLLSGAFDMAFVLTYLLPLLAIAWCFQLVSGEREQGTLRLVLASRLSGLQWLATKALVRWAALWLVVGLCVVALVMMQASVPLQWMRVLGVLALCGAYLGFWCALCAALNVLRFTSAMNALLLLGAWVLLTLVAPVVLQVVVQWIEPMPSRTELAARTRLVTIEGLRRHQDQLQADYRYVADPGALLPKQGRFEVPARRLASFKIAQEVDREIEALLAQFEVQKARQQAWVEKFSWISPAIGMHEALTALAGTDAARYARFQADVAQHHEQWKAFFEPRMTEGIAIQREDFERLPAFESSAGLARPERVGQASGARFIAMALLLLGIAWGLSQRNPPERWLQARS
jgi:ABC-2 type transport system permease protein